MLSECNRSKATNLCANVKTGISFFFFKREIMSQSGLLSQPRPLCSSSSEGNGPRCVCPHAEWKKRAIPMDAFHLIAVIGNQTNQLTANGNVDGAGFFSISADLRRAMQTKTSIVLKKKRKRD